MTDEQTQQQPEEEKVDGWYIVDLFGRQKFAGYLTTVMFGTETMFRLKIPGLEESTRVETWPGYRGAVFVPAGATIKEAAVETKTKYFGVKAIHSMDLCTREMVMDALEQLLRDARKVTIVQLPAKSIAPARDEPDPFDDAQDNAEEGEPFEESEFDEISKTTLEALKEPEPLASTEPIDTGPRLIGPDDIPF